MIENQDTRDRLLQDPIPKLIWNFSYPHFISYFLFYLNGMVDSIFVGRGLSINALAGVGIAFPLSLTAMSIAWGVGTGSASIIARSIGENQSEKAFKALTNGVFILLGFSMLAIAMALFIPEVILRFLGADAQTLDFAQGYFVAYALGMAFHLLSLYGSTVLGAYGHPRQVMFANVIGVPINIFLNYLFIFQFGWGTAGSASATNIASIFTLVYIIASFHRTKLIRLLSWKNISPRFSFCKEILRLGLPVFIFNLSAEAVLVYMNRYLSFHGEAIYLALLNIFIRLISIAAIPYYAIDQGLYPIIGFNYGAKRYDRVIKTIQLALGISFALALATTAMALIFTQPILRLFSSEPALLEEGVSLLRITFSTWPFISLVMIGMGLLSAIGNAKAALRLSFINQILISVISIILLPHYFGIRGIFYHHPLIDGLGGIIAGFFISSQLRPMRKLVANVAVKTDLKNT